MCLEEKLLYGTAASCPDLTPSEVGITLECTPAGLKALDLGGGDQRKLSLLLDTGDIEASEALLAKIKSKAACYSCVHC